MARIVQRGKVRFIPHEIDQEVCDELFKIRELQLVNYKGWEGYLGDVHYHESADEPVVHWRFSLVIHGVVMPMRFSGQFPVKYDPPWNDRFDREDVL